MRRFLFSVEGRLDRLGYLFLLLLAAVLFLAPAAMLMPTIIPRAWRWPDAQSYRSAVLGGGALCWVLVMWIYCAATSRRLHDANCSGWLTLLGLVPGIGLGALTMVLLLLPGSKGVNRFGARWL